MWNCLKKKFRAAVKLALAEDIGSGDATTLATVPKNLSVRAVHAARANRSSSPESDLQKSHFANCPQKSKSKNSRATDKKLPPEKSC